MKTILIPTDFSPAAQNAVQYALQLFGSDYKFILMNAFEEPRTTSSSMISLREILHENSVENLEQQAGVINTLFPEQSKNLTTASEYGSAVETICAMARVHHVDMIVMGTTGASGLKEIFIGSVASGVVNKAECPVLIVPSTSEYEAPKKLLVASNLNLQFTLPESIQRLITMNDSEVTVLTVNKPDQENSQKEAESNHGLNLHTIRHKFEVVESEDVEGAIIKYAESNDMNMVITKPHKHSWFSRLLIPSVSQKLAQHINVPMLALCGSKQS